LVRFTGTLLSCAAIYNFLLNFEIYAFERVSITGLPRDKSIETWTAIVVGR
jgi:hypothetical protein